MISTFLLFLLAAMAALCTERLKAAWCVAACLLYALTVYNVHSEVEGTLSNQEQQARSLSSSSTCNSLPLSTLTHTKEEHSVFI